MFIDGKRIAETILEHLKAEADKLPFRPLFCDMMIGNDPVSLSYIKIKERAALRIGLDFRQIQLPEAIGQQELEDRIHEAGAMERLCGLIIQLPLPPHLDRDAALDAIDPALDADCITPRNAARFYAGEDVPPPPTAAAILEILDSLRLDLAGKRILVVGQGDLVGRPVTYLLRRRGLEVATADKRVADLASAARQADVIITGTGQPKLITGDMVKLGAVVIDAGTSESGSGISGDVDIASVEPAAAYLSPVPGGVGPVTVAMLMKNAVRAAAALQS